MTLKQRLLLHAPGLTPSAVLEKLAEIKMIDVWIPTVDQRWLILPRLHTTFSRRQATHREVEIAVAGPAATAPGHAKTELRNRGTNRTVGWLFCGEDLSLSKLLLIPKHLTGSDVPKWESSSGLGSVDLLKKSQRCFQTVKMETQRGAADRAFSRGGGNPGRDAVAR